MADISSYPQATPKGSDRVLGVQAYVEGDDSTAGNPTKTFTINDINNLVPRSDGDSLYIDTELTSAQILNLHITPVTTLPEAGNGDLYIVDKVFLKYSFGTTAYSQSAGNSIFLTQSYYNNGVRGVDASNPLGFTTISDTTYVAIGRYSNSPPIGGDDIKIATNNPITLGDGTVKVRIYYKVIPSTF